MRQGENFLSPDVTVSCVPESGRTLRHPVLIIEILSPSTANVDRGEKWTLYRTLESLRHYLLIEQHRMAAELLSRNDAADAWTLSLHEGADAVLRLDALDVSLPLSELYRGIDFEAPAA